LQQEVPHLRQIANPELSDELSELSEANLSNWSQKPVTEQLEIARLQLELEIDAQKQLLIQYGWDPKLNETLARLNARLEEVQSAIETGVRPSWLDPDRPPRLFSHGGYDPSLRPTLSYSWIGIQLHVQEKHQNRHNAEPMLQMSRYKLGLQIRSMISWEKLHLVSM